MPRRGYAKRKKDKIERFSDDPLNAFPTFKNADLAVALLDAIARGLGYRDWNAIDQLAFDAGSKASEGSTILRSDELQRQGANRELQGMGVPPTFPGLGRLYGR